MATITGVLTTAGKEWLTDILDGTASVPADFYIGWGTGSTAAAVGDTALEAEVDEAGGDRIAVVQTQPSSTVSRFVASLEAPVALDGLTIHEVGVFTDVQAGPGVMLMRATDVAQLVATGDTITFTWNWTHA